ncbi:zymogen granule membrane protein 16 [Stegastes partitus]|uniref:Zymogen granule membrane protein 16 n=1 Tax=Stegastes partitus TaxID=144197 RepID=A0A3B4ZZF2_9TELE|nr:PREDICTED: zymogen granule membrane protein 16 [Stegastes partitus]
MNRMLCWVLVLLLAASVQADEEPHFSYSPAVGSASGAESTLTGNGRITAVRVWSGYSSFIFGLQLRFGAIWSQLIGRKVGDFCEMELFEGEAIVQVSGKYGRFIQQLVFVTSRGRFLMAGQPSYHSFNMYPAHQDAELVFVSTRYRGALTAFAAHWAVVKEGRW